MSYILLQTVSLRAVPHFICLTNLRSSEGILLATVKGKTKVTLGNKSFTVAAPRLWNVPSQSHELQAELKQHLKTYFFYWYIHYYYTDCDFINIYHYYYGPLIYIYLPIDILALMSYLYLAYLLLIFRKGVFSFYPCNALLIIPWKGLIRS